MTEQANRLHETLDELHQQLTSLESLDDESRQHLLVVTQEIQDLLGQPDHEEHGSKVMERLQAAQQQFQSSHPVVAGIIQRTVDALASIGI